MAQAFAVDSGRSMGAAQVACRLLWQGLSLLKEADKRKLLNLPTSRESLFGSDMQTLVDRMESAAKASVQLAPHLCPQRCHDSAGRMKSRPSPRRPGPVLLPLIIPRKENAVRVRTVMAAAPTPALVGANGGEGKHLIKAARPVTSMKELLLFYL